MVLRPPCAAAATVLLLCMAALPLGIGYSIQREEDQASIDALGASQFDTETVNSKQGLLTILTPVYPDEHTLSLLRNQLRTFAAFVDISSFAAWMMVTPAAKLATLQMFLDFELGPLPQELDNKIVLVTDEACVPELEPSRFALIAFNDAVFIPGWFKQQLLKLGCAHLIKTPFYLITDADTFYLNPFSAGDLFHVSACNSTEQHIVCNAQRSEAYRAKTELQSYVEGQQLQWIINSADTLELPVPQGEESSGVTPQIFARPLVAAVVAHINQLVKKEYWEHMPWRVYMCGRLTLYYYLSHHKGLPKDHAQPWTEFNVYWVFAEHAGLWDNYHVRAHLASYRTNAWGTEQFEQWDPCASIQTDQWNPGYWAVFQSTMGVSGEAIWAKLKRCVPANRAIGSTGAASAVQRQQQQQEQQQGRQQQQQQHRKWRRRRLFVWPP